MSSSAILNSSIIESLDGMETIKSYNSEQNVYETVQNQFLNLMKKSYKTVTLDNMQRSIKQSVQLLTSAGVLWAGSYIFFIIQ
ncbi:ABC transporter transmembrane domain-containing protein [Dolosigranulum pigrum]|uniref:ABC transporter transmembrane domain-containing protein n=1 Tax=Dolosigranulum pigrum TaxID=29394 RepID=UPI00244DE8D7|nr:ABC transporter transmembrane domain-containing protein [Dolosigranulum pigrum]